MKYVSPEYQKQLEDLAETLCTPERYGKAAEDLGQLVLFELVEAPVEQSNGELRA